MNDPKEEINVPEMVDTQFKVLFEQLNTITKFNKELSEGIKNIQKTCKLAEKMSKKKKRIQTKNYLSKDLEQFLNVEHGTPLTKAEVMQGISKYIKEKNLQLSENKRQFKPDKKLFKYFGMDTKQPLTFVEIGGHISNHLTKV
tara:strand:- start:312 stop:740 length:429 start_codon:yes stop_codon:yes gene_type:complete